MTERSKKIPIVIVAGIGKDTRAIGKANGLLWHVPDDLKRFKELTMGHPVIMGRKTFESILDILGKPFPGRTNIIVTRDINYQHKGVNVAHSFDKALEMAKDENSEEIHIGGGEEIYKLALPYTDKLYITEYHDSRPGDVYFPVFADDFKETARHGIREHNGIKYEWVDYERKRNSRTQ